MKKLLAILGLLVLFAGVMRAQDCPFKVKFTVTPATCYNNGKVAYALVDDAGEALTALPVGMEARIFYKIYESDSAHYGAYYPSTGGWDTLVIDYGEYWIGVEVMCPDGNGGFKRSDTVTKLNVNTTYVKPNASALYVTAKAISEYGKHPSLECVNSGRIQLKIEGGKFPYSVTVKDHNTSDVYRNVVFYERQNSGSNELAYDYKDYYTFDSLPPGDWDFYVVDGCDYGLPRTGQTVEIVEFPKLSYVEVFASSGNFRDKNVVKINAVLDNDFSYYSALLPEHAQYRFVYDGLHTTGWKAFPKIQTGYRAVLYDTVPNILGYCDLWDINITFEYRLFGCGDELISKTFQYHKPNEAYFKKSKSDIVLKKLSNENPCVDQWRFRTRYHSIEYDVLSLENNLATANNDHYLKRYHFTHPLTWIYSDLETGLTIKKDTISRINNLSTISAVDIENNYGSFEDSPRRLKIERTLVDAQDCILFSTIDTLVFKYGTGEDSVAWEIDYSDYVEDHCCDKKRFVRVYEDIVSTADGDGSIVRLVKSPYNNRYNFEAVYSSDNKVWNIRKNNLENMAEVVPVKSLNGIGVGGVMIQDYCLPSGLYQFEIFTPCDTFFLSKNILFGDIYKVEMTEEPVFVRNQHCTDQYISYSAGKFSRVAYNTSQFTGLDTTPKYVELPSYFQVVSGPVGGYDKTLHRINEQIRLSMPGEYVVKISPSTSMAVCDLPSYYDTVVYDGSTVDFHYAVGLMCETTSSTGDIFVEGLNGTPPYKYILYDSLDKQGQVLETNTTGRFENIPMSQDKVFSCLIKDDCESYFHMNITPRTLAEMQKVWWDGGVDTMVACEGTHVRINALEIGNILEYEWSGPDGFVSDVSSPEVFIPRGASGGWYHVSIKNTGCADMIKDSVYLIVLESPSLSLSNDPTVCPGEEIELEFVPTSPVASDEINFTISFSTPNATESRSYVAASNQSVTDIYSTFKYAKIFSTTIDDGRCIYKMADDTLRVNMRTDIANSCNLTISYDSACYRDVAHFEAKSSFDPPYVIRWFGDYNLTDLRKEQTIYSADDVSEYDTIGLMEKSFLFVSLEKEGVCPTVHGISKDEMNIEHGATTLLNCGDSYRLYDSGGKDGDYNINEMSVHRFVTSDNSRVSVRFEELNLSNTAHIIVISGELTDADSVLYDLTNYSTVPDIIVSNGNALTIMFMGGMKTSSGFSALVEYEPEIAIANIRPKNHVFVSDVVCQSQVNNYISPEGIVPYVVEQSVLNDNIRKAGTYYYNKTFEKSDVNGCDSTVTFVLTVNNPPHYDTTVVTTNMHGNSYTWHGVTYSESGRYSHLISLPDGCDSLDVLNFIILQIDTTSNEICSNSGDSTLMGIMVTEPEILEKDDLLPSTKIGDIVCSDGTILTVDAFLESNKFAKGVIFYVDNTGNHGYMLALSDTMASFAPQTVERYVGFTYNEVREGTGLDYTESIKKSAEIAEGSDFKINAPAAYYCYYYDHITMSTGNNHQGWWLPNKDEVRLLLVNLPVVSQSLLKLKTWNDNVKLLDLSDSNDLIMTSVGSINTSSTYSYWIYPGICMGHTINKRVVDIVRPITSF